MIESSREMATLSAETASGLGFHLAQMGQIVSAGNSTEAVKKIQTEKSRYEKYLANSKDRRKKLELQLLEEQDNMVAYKRQMGNAKGVSLLDELRVLQKRVKELEHLLGTEKELLEGERRVRVKLEAMQEASLERVKNMVKMWLSDNAAKLIPVIVTLWKRYADSEVKFKFKEVATGKDLMVERHRKMRKDCCNRVLNSIRVTRSMRVAAWCWVGFQEELIERRQERLQAELNRRHENALKVMENQVAQASGDEEKSKAAAAEQYRMMEEAHQATERAEKQRDEARAAEVKMEEAKQAAEHRTEVALGEKKQALEEKHEAEVFAQEKVEETKVAKEETRVMNVEKTKALEEKKDAQLMQQQAERRNEKLTRSLNELGAESDDDEPEEDKPAPWFLDEQGVKQPRPRTRKERMAMSFNESLVMRQEMKLQLAAIIDKDLRAEDRIDKLIELVRQQDRCLSQLRYANMALQGDLKAETNLRHNQNSHEVLKPLQHAWSSGALVQYNPKNIAAGKPRAASNSSKRKPGTGTLIPISTDRRGAPFHVAWR